jgi:hypothetical protein
MKTIWKFQIPVPTADGSAAIETPLDWSPLSLQWQDGHVCVWAIVNPASLKVRRALLVLGTGWDVPQDRTLVHLGTYQEHDGAYVWHVFDCPMRAEVIS